ncbi:MAG: 30S ribosomal protein S12 methylthiotransferase RimO [Bacteroidales bacterium]|nr:30S ribosomal protein S12 methylthiotransferase RimO [Bacteroidales bacterium]
MKINIITLGCSKNVVDSEAVGGRLKKAGFELFFDSVRRDCDVTIVNTCGFIADAKAESIATLLEQASMKQRGRRKRRIIAVGCLIERYKKEMQQEMPEIDAFYGAHEWGKLVDDIVTFAKPTPQSGTKAAKAPRITPRHYAFLKIAEGCNRRCAFCAIPSIRGPYVSRPIEQLVEEAKQLTKEGAKEIIVIAQDTTYYGLDLYGERKLGTLLDRLATESGARWIRLHYTFPANFPEDAIQAMRRHPSICNYIDIPLQHINSAVLRGMQRGIDRDGTLRLLRHLREELPDAAFRTTLIVGFPGETNDAFEELKDFVVQARFDRLGVFAYSREEGTPAYGMGETVSEEEKQRRVDEIMSLQERISLEKNEARVGSLCEALIDRKEGDYYIGRTQYDSPDVDDEVLISSSKPLRAGHFYQVRITGAYEHDLRAELA